MIIEFKIVGINKIIEDKATLENFLDSSIGKTVMLEMEPDNLFDPSAIAAYLDGKQIGYVRGGDPEKENIRQQLIANKRNTCSATVKARSDGYETLVATVNCTHYAIADVDDEVEKYLKWKYPGLILKPIQEWKDLKNTIDSMITYLEDGVATEDNMRNLMNNYKELAVYGFSEEFFKDRQKLYKNLKVHKDDKLRGMAKEMEEMSGYLHDNKAHLAAYTHIQKELKKQIGRERKEETMRLSLNEMEEVMRRFPDDLYELYSSNLLYFPSRLFYIRLPRQVLMKLVSGIALCGYLGKQTNTTKKINCKEKKNDKVKCDAKKTSLLPFFCCHPDLRDKWIRHMKEMVLGKKNGQAACVMQAYVACGVLDKAPWKAVRDSIGGIGTERLYNDAIRQYKEHPDEGFQYLCDQIEDYKKKI